jgi:hypothetical protein
VCNWWWYAKILAHAAVPCAQAFTYFDKDNDAQLTVREMKDSVTAVFKERKNMAHSLKVGPAGWAWRHVPPQQRMHCGAAPPATATAKAAFCTHTPPPRLSWNAVSWCLIFADLWG